MDVSKLKRGSLSLVRRERHILSNGDMHQFLADFLMIDADGGDDPAAVIKGALEEYFIDRRAAYYENRASELRGKDNG